MKIDVILGLQWGDEGKGKIVDFLAPRYDIVARFQGGPNAGHTLKFDGKKYVLHTIPSGIFRESLVNLIGNGVVIDPVTMVKELKNVEDAGVAYLDRLLISRKAHLILPTHRYLDLASESVKGKEKIGSTLKGIGPTYMDKTGRNGLRIGDIHSPQFLQKYESLKAKHLTILTQLYPEVAFDLQQEEERWMACVENLRQLPQVDGEYYLNQALKAGKRVLAEGAQGAMLDIDFGTYPYVTSSNTITAGVCSGLGVAPQCIGEVIGVAKAYCTRVGSGPFPTEQDNETGEFLRKEGGEFGATTGRPRRCGWLDVPQLLYTIMLNGVTQIALTKIDVLNTLPDIPYARSYRLQGQETAELPYDLCDVDVNPVYATAAGWGQSLEGMTTYDSMPAEARRYIDLLEVDLGVPISMISTGPERRQLVLR